MDIENKDIIVSSWSELCGRLYDGSWQADIGRFRSNYAFRGVSDKLYDLKTSFMRTYGTHPHLEQHLLRNFRKYAEISVNESYFSDWRWMTIAQHHSLPTRLLDWTYSPFIAAHFVTDDTSKYDSDGAIWCVDFVEVNRMLPSLLSNELIAVGANVFTLGMLESALPDIGSLERLGKDLVVFFEPPAVDDRIVNQFALFSAMSTSTSQLDVWLEHNPDLYKRLIIPKELKWEVRDKLDQANITERMLYPGLDGLASWLKRHYKP